MGRKFCLAVSLAGMLLLPVKSEGADITVFDQFADAANAGLFQGVFVASELALESVRDDNSVQGLNVISGLSLSGKIVQAADLEGSLSMMMTEGSNVVQGMNVYRGSADEIQQIAVINGTLTMTSSNNKGSIQGINVITSCDSCY